MIIVEGPDGAGKTRLVAELMARFPELEKGERNPDRSQLWKTGASDVYKAIAHDLNPENTCRIWDRLFFSELVYAPIMGRPCCFGSVATQYVSRMLEAMRTPVLWCMPGYETVLENVHATAQHDWVAGNEEVIYNSYHMLEMKWLGRPRARSYHYNYNVNNVASMRAIIEGHINYRKALLPREPLRLAT